MVDFTNDRTIMIHGFTDEEVISIIKAVKKVSSDPEKIAFSMTTEKNINWTVNQLLSEVQAEHEYIMKHPLKRE